MPKVTIIYDNRCDHSHLQAGWGFSAFIEFQGNTILFDTGGDVAAFTSNANKLNLSYQDISYLLFSHRHWDHIAGFGEIIQKIPEKASLYVPKTFSRRLLKTASSHFKDIHVVRSFEAIAPDLYSLVLRGGFWLYEQALIIKTPKGLGIITGCAHPGIVHILEEAQKHLSMGIAFVLGGFHMFSASVKKREDVVREFQRLGVQKVAPCHCSGDLLIHQLQEVYGSSFVKVGTGSVLVF
jgi:7,8-dihydropterin-6-yl-methyl-4-(beta-D-ribofuranosyl)aminobenzene 5'-phosphate synthase